MIANVKQIYQTWKPEREREMAELFIKQAENYADGRPCYPQELFEFIASKTPSHDLAWDVGTGNGQAARSVSFHFSFPPIYIYMVFFFFFFGISYRVFEV